MQPAGSPAPSATSPAPSPTQGAPPTAPPATATANALASLGALVAGPQLPPPAMVIRYAPPVRLVEIAALIAIVALADLALYQGDGGARLAALFAGVPMILFTASEIRARSGRFAV